MTEVVSLMQAELCFFFQCEDLVKHVSSGIVYIHLTVGYAAGSITYTQMSLIVSNSLWRMHTSVAPLCGKFESLATPLNPLTTHTCAGHYDSHSA